MNSNQMKSEMVSMQNEMLAMQAQINRIHAEKAETQERLIEATLRVQAARLYHCRVALLDSGVLGKQEYRHNLPKLLATDMSIIDLMGNLGRENKKMRAIMDGKNWRGYAAG